MIICPCGNVIDPELLFADHIHSFTRENLAALLEREGLPTSTWQPGASELSPFQAVYAAKIHEPRRDDHPPQGCDRQGAQLRFARDEFCRRWAELDDVLLDRLEGAASLPVLAPVKPAICCGRMPRGRGGESNPTASIGRPIPQRQQRCHAAGAFPFSLVTRRPAMRSCWASSPATTPR